MKRIVRLTESDLTRIVKRVINEQSHNESIEKELNNLGYSSDPAKLPPKPKGYPRTSADAFSSRDPRTGNVVFSLKDPRNGEITNVRNLINTNKRKAKNLIDLLTIVQQSNPEGYESFMNLTLYPTRELTNQEKRKYPQLAPKITTGDPSTLPPDMQRRINQN